MTARVCLGCQVAERRGVDPHGRPTVNLNPLTDLWLDCTVTATREAGPYHQPAPLPFDSRAAAANDRGDA